MKYSKQLTLGIVYFNVRRRFIPKVMVTISGLNPADVYDVCLAIVSEDSYKYKFFDNEWIKDYKSTLTQDKERQMMIHRASPNTGRFWMSGLVNFKEAMISHHDVAENIVSI